MKNIFLTLLMLSVLTACVDYRSSSPELVAAVEFSSREPSSVTLLTVVSIEGIFTSHSALLINASQQVLYDPAGSFRHLDVARSGDISYGMTPEIVQDFKSYHSRSGHYVMAQEIEVPSEVAEEILRQAEDLGAAAFLLCAYSTSTILSRVEMFSHITITMYPGDIVNQFTAFPGVEVSYTHENDRVKAY